MRDTLRNDAVFSNRANEHTVGAVFGQHQSYEMDGREHLRNRNIVTPALAPRALKGDFAEFVATIAHELIDGFAADGRVDLVSDFTFTFPIRVFTQILGLPGRGLRRLPPLVDRSERHRRRSAGRLRRPPEPSRTTCARSSRSAVRSPGRT